MLWSGEAISVSFRKIGKKEKTNRLAEEEKRKKTYNYPRHRYRRSGVDYDEVDYKEEGVEGDWPRLINPSEAWRHLPWSSLNNSHIIPMREGAVGCLPDLWGIDTPRITLAAPMKEEMLLLNLCLNFHYPVPQISNTWKQKTIFKIWYASCHSESFRLGLGRRRKRYSHLTGIYYTLNFYYMKVTEKPWIYPSKSPRKRGVLQKKFRGNEWRKKLAFHVCSSPAYEVFCELFPQFLFLPVDSCVFQNDGGVTF